MQKLALSLSIIILAPGMSLAQTSGFTYQGKLAASGAPANGDYQICIVLSREGDPNNESMEKI